MSNPLFTFAWLLLFTLFDQGDPWLKKDQGSYTYYYQTPDEKHRAAYREMLNKGTVVVKEFFQKSFPKPFSVYVHPTRESWDKKLQEAYQMPDFKSECWMVASGDGFQLNMISPATWGVTSCEHTYSDKVETQRLLTHELFHVFHGQHNASPDFGQFEGLDWLAEGFATYASGQLTSQREEDIRTLVKSGDAPSKLDEFWKGKHRYGLAGSLVQYVDATYGREWLFKILAFNKKPDVLAALKISEEDLIANWKKSIR